MTDLADLLKAQIVPLRDRARTTSRAAAGSIEDRLSRALATGEFVAYSRVLAILPFMDLMANGPPRATTPRIVEVTLGHHHPCGHRCGCPQPTLGCCVGCDAAAAVNAEAANVVIQMRSMATPESRPPL